jgi:MFS family permease
MHPVAPPSSRSIPPVHALFAARALRDFGDSFVAILLPAYLLALGFTPLEVGVLATASLLGSAGLTIAAGFLGARYGYRALLLAAACLMIATGIAFASFHDFAVLLVIAFVGTINPSAGNVSVFVPLEHAALAREAGDTDRTRMFAHYSLAGALAAALGSLAAATPGLLAPLGLDRLAAMQGMFVLYGLLGVAGRLLYARLPRYPSAPEAGETAALGPSRKIVFRLAALFSLDAFAGGFVVQSLLVLWLFQRFHL